MSNLSEKGTGLIEVLNTPIGVRVDIHWEIPDTAFIKWIPFEINGRLHKITTNGSTAHTIAMKNIHAIDMTSGVATSVVLGSYPVFQTSSDVRIWAEGRHYIHITIPFAISPAPTGRTSIWFEPANKELFGYYPRGVVHV